MVVENLVRDNFRSSQIVDIFKKTFIENHNKSKGNKDIITTSITITIILSVSVLPIQLFKAQSTPPISI